MAPVKLYVYDLSKGLAKSMSMMLTGKQIDGIWHTSVVAYGREIFFGQGILESIPGQTHHGQPVQVIDCGDTEIDEATFQEYLTSLEEMYTPDKYHLIEFNCNHFTADVIGFLTGAEIPSWISGLPAEFLSTPFGQSMKPQIDAMFRRTTPSEHPATNAHRASTSTLPTPPPSGATTPSPLASSLLGSIAASATANGSHPTPSPTPPVSQTSPLTLVSSVSLFNQILKDNKAVVVNFTNTPSCPPCRVIKPIYESLSAEFSQGYGRNKGGLRFLEVELGVGEGRDLAGRYGIRATPTFAFFENGQKKDVMAGADKRGLEVKISDFLESVWPRHPHRKAYLPQSEKLSLSPISSAGVPNYTALVGKLESFGAESTQITIIRSQLIPALEGKVNEAQTTGVIGQWGDVSSNLLGSLGVEQVFPVLDLWRVALLNTQISAAVAMDLLPTRSPNLPILPIITLIHNTVSAQGSSTPKPFLLTALRLLTNIIASLPLANVFLSAASTYTQAQEQVIGILVESLLHADSGVRSAAAGLAVNVASWRHRLAKDKGIQAEDEDLGGHEWETEVLSAVIEGLAREADEDVAYRLLVSLDFMVYLSQSLQDQIKPLLDVLDTKSTVEKKAKGWKKPEVKKLAEELVSKIL